LIKTKLIFRADGIATHPLFFVHTFSIIQAPDYLCLTSSIEIHLMPNYPSRLSHMRAQSFLTSLFIDVFSAAGKYVTTLPKIALLSLLLTTALGFDAQNLVINELQASNGTTEMDESDDFDDWIEIANTTGDAINLSGWYISDDGNDLLKHQFMATDDELMVPAFGFLLLWADNEVGAGSIHLNFELAQMGETIYLTTPSEDLLHFVTYTFNWQDNSVGLNDDMEVVSFEDPTPAQPNTSASFAGTLSKPVFSEPGQVTFDVSIETTINHPTSGVELRYTMDGTTPNETSDLYSESIYLIDNTNIKVRAFHSDYLPSLTATASYLFEAECSNDIVSISCDPEDFSGSGGIDNNPNNGAEIEINFSLIHDGESVIDQTLGMKIHAADYRDQRSLRLYARGEYGESHLKYPFFDTRPFDEYKRLILRNAGNDGVEINGSGVRDALITGLMQDIDPEYPTSHWKPVCVYINGVYWGLYNMRERQDNDWLESLYGYEEDEVDFLERSATAPNTRTQWSGNWDDYDAMKTQAIEEDLSDDAAFSSLAEEMDVRNFIDYQCTEIYGINQDWLSNNMKYWRAYDEDVWRWIIWDLDWGIGCYYPSYPHGFPDWNSLSFSLSNWGGWTSVVETELFQNMVENEQFVDDLSTRAADLLNSYLREETVTAKLIDYQAQVHDDIPAQADQWGGTLSAWENELEYMYTFITDRPEFMRQQFTDQFGLGEIIGIDLNTMPLAAGYMEVNTISVYNFPWNGRYFEALDVRLKAIPNFGYEFDHWEWVDGQSFDDEIFIDISEVDSLTAFYMSTGSPTSPIITEIMYTSSNNTEMGDWIEIYNPSENPLNLAGWHVCAGSSCFEFPEATTIEAGAYQVVCNNSIGFEEFYGSEFEIYGDMSFGISQSGEDVFISNPLDEVTDFVPLDILAPWPMNVQDDRSIELVNVDLANDLGGNWISQTFIYGSPAEEFEEIITDITDRATTKVAVWPNPFQESFALALNQSLKGSYTLRLYDVLGKQIGRPYRGSSVPNANTILVGAKQFPNLENLAPGTYIINMEMGGQAWSTLLMKK
jgi:hypothetical protein